jgi:aspartate racemase
LKTIGLLGGMSWESSAEYYRLGQILPASRDAYRVVMGHLIDAGAEGIILGCTEIGLLIGEQDSPVPLFDTTRLRAEAAVTYALAERVLD